jgi:Flp pilus assembly pilin Flp
VQLFDHIFCIYHLLGSVIARPPRYAGSTEYQKASGASGKGTGQPLDAAIEIVSSPISAKRLLARLREDDSGQDVVEYALIAVSMGLFTVAGVHGLATSISNDILIVVNAFNAATAAH